MEKKYVVWWGGGGGGLWAVSCATAINLSRERLVVGAYDRQETPFILFSMQKKGSFSLFFFSLSLSLSVCERDERTCGDGRGDERKKAKK